MGKRILALFVVACVLLTACTQGATSNQQATELEKKPLDSYSWEELSRISNEISAAPSDEEGRAVAEKYGLVEADGSLTAQKKVIYLGEDTKLDVRLAGIRHDDRSDGTGKAGLTFMSSGAFALKKPMNDEATIEGGWQSAGLRSWLATEGKAMLDADLQEALVPVEKLTNNVGFTDDIGSVTSTSDEIWVFSVHEVCGDISWDADEYFYKRGDEDIDGIVNAEGMQYEVFRLAGVTQTSDPTGILALANTNTKVNRPWWYRTPFPFDWQEVDNTGSDGFFYRVLESGYPESIGKPNDPSAVVVGFCV